jgi:hypothetical protein
MALINPDTANGVNGQVSPNSSTSIGFNNNGTFQQVSPGQDMALPTQDQALQAAQSTDNPIKVSITGDETGDFAGVNILEQVVTDGTGLAMNTRVLNQPKVDANNALVPSDAPPNTILYLAPNVPQTIDATGYQTVVFQQSAASAITVTQSNDGVNFVPCFGARVESSGTSQAGQSALTSTTYGIGTNLLYSFPVIARYMRFSTATQTTVNIYLRQSSFISTAASIGLPVMGITATGQTASVNPVIVGGVDYGITARRILTDANGNLQAVGALPQGYQVGAYNVTYTGYTTTTGTTATAAQSANTGGVIMAGVDQTLASKRIQTDSFGALLVRGAPSSPASQSIEDLLTQILGTLRVLTHYTYEEQLRDGFRSTADEPDIMLADYLNPASTFNNMTN